MMIRLPILSLLLLASFGCSHGSTKVKDALIHTDVHDCVLHESCSLTGALSIEEINHVYMGRLKTSDMDCINISLPSRLVKEFMHKNDQKVVVTGMLFKTPVFSEDDLTLEYKINGRRVGWGQCLDVYLFVENAKDVKLVRKF